VSAPAGYPRIDSHQHFTSEYLPSLLFPILKRNKFDGSVVVASRPSVEETRWLLEQAAQHDFIRAVVGWADLADPRVGETLDEYQRHPKFRGVCDWFAGEFPSCLFELTRRGLSLDVNAGFTPALVDEIRRSRSRRLRTPSGVSVRMTEREWEILQLLDEGRTTGEIAAATFVAPVTIRTHIAAIVRKLDVGDRDQALEVFRRQRAAQAS